jgi:hypothetical protein
MLKKILNYIKKKIKQLKNVKWYKKLINSELLKEILRMNDDIVEYVKEGTKRKVRFENAIMQFVFSLISIFIGVIGAWGMTLVWWTFLFLNWAFDHFLDSCSFLYRCYHRIKRNIPNYVNSFMLYTKSLLDRLRSWRKRLLLISLKLFILFAYNYPNLCMNMIAFWYTFRYILDRYSGRIIIAIYFIFLIDQANTLAMGEIID